MVGCWWHDGRRSGFGLAQFTCRLKAFRLTRSQHKITLVNYIMVGISNES